MKGGAGVEEHLGRYTLRTAPGVFPVGRDSLLLGQFATVRPGWRVWDLGCGGGLLLLLLAQRAEGLELRGAELDPAAAELARENLRANGLTGEILTGDLTALPLPPGGADLAVSNPPYFQPGRGESGGPARCGETLSLPALCAAAARVVRPGGRFALCGRPERLADLLEETRRAGLEPKRLQLACHDRYHPPFLTLLECVRGGRPGLEVPAPILTEEREERS